MKRLLSVSGNTFLVLVSLLLVLVSFENNSSVVNAFVVPSSPGTATSRPSSSSFYSTTSDDTSISSSTTGNGLQKGDPVLLIGPGFLQLVIAKHMIRNGLKPIVVAPQTKLDNYFKSFIKTGNDESHVGDEDLEGIHQQIERDSTIGMPEVDDPYFGDIKGVVYCTEEAILPPDFIPKVLDYTDQGKSAFADGNDGAPTKVICCLPVSNKAVKEKSNSWIPIFNMSEKKQDEMWSKFESAFRDHSSFKSDDSGSIIRFGSLFGGSIDGPPILTDYGLDEGIYKMSMEQYRDMRERSFDRYKLSAQVLSGDCINEKPVNQEKIEKEALKEYPGNVREMFTILGDYPEIDRSNRHTVASGIVQSLLLDTSTVNTSNKEVTILSKASSELNTPSEWQEMFTNPSTTGGSKWPDPNEFTPEEFGIEKKS